VLPIFIAEKLGVEARVRSTSGDALSIYKPLLGGAIELLRVCNHDDIKDAKGKALVVTFKSE